MKIFFTKIGGEKIDFAEKQVKGGCNWDLYRHCELISKYLIFMGFAVLRGAGGVSQIKENYPQTGPAGFKTASGDTNARRLDLIFPAKAPVAKENKG